MLARYEDFTVEKLKAESIELREQMRISDGDYADNGILHWNKLLWVIAEVERLQGPNGLAHQVAELARVHAISLSDAFDLIQVKIPELKANLDRMDALEKDTQVQFSNRQRGTIIKLLARIKDLKQRCNCGAKKLFVDLYL